MAPKTRTAAAAAAAKPAAKPATKPATAAAAKSSADKEAAARRRAKSLREQLSDLAMPAASTDIDPESYDFGQAGSDRDDSDRASDAEEELALSRSHYTSVGKSKLRDAAARASGPAMGEFYKGKRASVSELYGDSTITIGSDSEDDSNSDEDDSNSDVDDEDEQSELSELSDEEEDDDDASEQDENDAQLDNSEDDSGDDEDDLRSRLASIAKEEQGMMANLAQDRASDASKGHHVRSQMRLWEKYLDVRIRTQPLVAAANRLPTFDKLSVFIGSSEQPAAVDQLSEARQTVETLLGDLLDMRTSSLAHFPATNVSEAAMKAKRRELLAASMRGNTNGDGDDDDESDKDEASPAARADMYWQLIEHTSSMAAAFTDRTLTRWSNQVMLGAAAGGAKKQLKAFNQDAVSQIKQVLADKDRLLARTQLMRSSYAIIGGGAQDEDSNDGDAPSPSSTATRDRTRKSATSAEIFDDADHYQQLLRELIETRTGASSTAGAAAQTAAMNAGGADVAVDDGDLVASGLRVAAMRQQVRDLKAQTRQVDTRASKGRKLRYDVHDKLQNFMVPVPIPTTWNDDMVDELYVSLLGKKVAATVLTAEEDSAALASSMKLPDGMEPLRLFT